MLYCDVLLPVTFSGHTFTYSCPEELPVPEVGSRVTVTLHGKVCNGIVSRVHSDRQTLKILPLKAVLETTPLFTNGQIALFRWVSSYYMCTMGNVLRTTTPQAIRTDSYTPSTQLAVVMNLDINLEEALETLKKRKAVIRTLDLYLATQKEFTQLTPISKKELMVNGASPTGLKTLIDSGILNTVKIPLKRYSASDNRHIELSLLGDSIVNSSIPTLLYENSSRDILPLLRELIAHTSSNGNMTLIVTPDNYSAIMIEDSLSDEFQILPYHTKCPINARNEGYLRLLNTPETIDAVVGTNQSLFLPYKNLGLVIVLNENDYGHKSERNHNSNSRDIAMVLAQQFHASVMMTTKAPSMEMYTMSIAKRCQIVAYDDHSTHPVSVKLLEKGKKDLFSKYLLKRMEEVLEAKGQVLILQNRRGFASSVTCSDCGETPMCHRCNVMLTLHSMSRTLNCHYCGYTVTAPKVCPSCGSPNIAPQGMGTERVVELLTNEFPAVRIARVDADTASRKDTFGEINEDNAAAKADIIVGTQLVTRGLRPQNVQLAAVINADNMFLSTDFRTSERALANILQLKAMVQAGGELIIQSSNTKNPTLKAIEWNEIDAFYERELRERIELKYPPAVRLIVIKLSYKERGRLFEAANFLDKQLQQRFGNRSSPPYEPAIDRIDEKYILEMMVRFDRNPDLVRNKAILWNEIELFKKRFSLADVNIEVDPI